MTGRPQGPLSDDGAIGPAMNALPNDRWREFVIALCEQPVVNYAQAAAKADPEGWGRTAATSKNAGYRLAHDDRVQAAVAEEGKRRMGAAVAVSVAHLIQIAESNVYEPKDRMKAIAMILNRAGLPETKEVKVSTTRVLNEAEKIDSIIRFAEKLGVDPRTLLGDAGIEVPKRLNPPSPTVGLEPITDATFEEAEDWNTL